MTGKAVIVRELNPRQLLLRLDPPARLGYGREWTTEFVVSSKALAWTGVAVPLGSSPFMNGFSGGNPREVLVFPAREDGSIRELLEIGGSYDEPDGHVSALAGMGYELVTA